MGTCKYCGKDAYGMPDGRGMMDEGRGLNKHSKDSSGETLRESFFSSIFLEVSNKVCNFAAEKRKIIWHTQK